MIKIIQSQSFLGPPPPQVSWKQKLVRSSMITRNMELMNLEWEFSSNSLVLDVNSGVSVHGSRVNSDAATIIIIAIV